MMHFFLPKFSAKFPAFSFFRDKYFLFLFLWVLLVCVALSHANAQKESPWETMVKTLINGHGQDPYYEVRAPWCARTMLRFYEARDYAPAWLDDDGDWQRDMPSYIALLEKAHQHALDPDDYPLRRIVEAPMDPRNVQQRLTKDIAVTNELIQYIHDVKTGRVNPSTVFPSLFLLRGPYDVAAVLQRALRMPDQEAVRYLADLGPERREYKALKQALNYYREVAARGEWTDLPYRGLIRPGDTSSQIPMIRQRIVQLEQLHHKQSLRPGWGLGGDHAQQDKQYYDPELEKIIRALQDAYHVKVDGVIGPDTLAILNMSLEDRIRKIALAMERWRWMPDDMGEKYVLVNIAGFYTDGVVNGETLLHSPVIVGEVAHATPSFSSRIESVKFFPDWTVPYSIARRYLLEKVQKNPSMIAEQGYELYRDRTLVPWSQVDVQSLRTEDFPPYHFRQKPGRQNALGLVRFTFDNPYSIFMHDTPQGALFAENKRTFSSGCIRVGKPVELAQFLLSGNSGLSPRDVIQQFKKADAQAYPETEVVRLLQPVPVHITYMTAWVDQKGHVEFAPDVYGRDAKLEQALQADE